MKIRSVVFLATVSAVLALAACSTGGPGAGQNKMGFFLTSVNPGKGADFGGIAGADRYCQSLATGVGAGGRMWHAYLSETPAGGRPAVNARDRIGKGPWFNAKGDLIARNVDDLHNGNGLNKQTALTEKGTTISGRGDPVNMHDVLTGSSPDGRAVVDGKDTTCRNWTTSGDGSALVGHHDRIGLRDDAPSKSWNSSHPSQGCGLEALKKTGGAGLLYCFAVQ
ncbi:MAG: hypothetical protein KKC79_19540 [Gammaproteobacteria bacterium]|nr:hypothetical protein [Gammaproteobacteria bacterium]MBU1440433.1 hypothetical protein [Gammaproteobacteria bacterium]MBU2284918.1 hypothetical protein [Gammaproteobacteria bacterium]MBU2410830.1 hypothetical protein [Gammaproteobacteria bacterium]